MRMKFFIYTFVVIMSFNQLANASSIYGERIKRIQLQDDDVDGVINVRDRCPGTPSNSAVDNYGCHKENAKLLSVELKILFDSGKYVVKPQFFSEVKKLADFMQKNAGSTVIIEGHTDDVGSEALNQELSQNRASAIAKVLIDSFRIEASRVEAIGYGESRPLTSNDTPEGRTLNRRVVAEIFAKTTVQIERWDIYSVDRR